jgi:transketolase
MAGKRGGRGELVFLREKAKKVRGHILKMIHDAGSGHPGGSLSCVEVLTALFFHAMRHRPRQPGWVGRDRFVLSKGHAAPALYAVLAEAGYFPVRRLCEFRRFGGMLQGHPHRGITLGVEVSSGSLGQGLSVAVGMALAGRLDGRGYRVFVLLGDGECDEGQVWEAAMAAAHYRLDNLVVFVDRNGLQIDGPTELVMSVEPLADKWRSFGWNVVEVDGHDVGGIVSVLDSIGRGFFVAGSGGSGAGGGLERLGVLERRVVGYENDLSLVVGPDEMVESWRCRNLPLDAGAGGSRVCLSKGRPTVVLAHMVKGKGVSFMEWVAKYHGTAPNREEFERASCEIENAD